MKLTYKILTLMLNLKLKEVQMMNENSIKHIILYLLTSYNLQIIHSLSWLSFNL